MTTANWNSKVLAQSEDIVMLEGNSYFPKNSVNHKFLRPSTTKTFCPWKGEASYYDVLVDGKINKDAAWYYKNPGKNAKEIKDHIAFWNGVEVKQ